MRGKETSNGVTGASDNRRLETGGEEEARGKERGKA